MKKKLVVIAAAAGIAAILAGGAGLYFMTAPSLTFARKWEQGETEGLGELYSTRIQGRVLEEKLLRKKMEGKAESLAADYLAGRTEYESAMEKLGALQEIPLYFMESELENSIESIGKPQDQKTADREDTEKQESAEAETKPSDAETEAAVLVTETPAETETERSAETEKPTETEETAPETTAEPETPEKTEAPTETEPPTETEAPTETEIPTETEAPKETESETEKAAETEAPTESQRPSADSEDPGSVTILDLSDRDLAELPDLSIYPNLEILGINLNRISDLSPCADAPKLREIYAAGNNFTTIDPLYGMTALEELGLSGSAVSDISAAASLPNLKRLDVRRTRVSDISMLSDLTSLEMVLLSYSNVTSIEPLMNLPNLKEVSIKGLGIPQEEIDEFTRLHPDCILYIVEETQ